MSSSQQNASRGSASVTDKVDHKSTLDGGLKMKIMRAKSTDSGSSATSGSSGGVNEPKHKLSKNDSNGLQTSSDTHSGQQTAGSTKKHRDKEPKGGSTAASRHSDLDESSNSSSISESNPKSGKMPSTTFSTENMPLSNLFSGQTSKYPSYSYAAYANASRGGGGAVTNQFDPLDTSPKNGSSAGSGGGVSGGGGFRNVQSVNFGTKTEPTAINNKKRKCSTGAMVDQCVGTSFGTMTEPECLGPCEPGTSVNLDGIVWHETADGILVVNATWRGRSYVGTLLDSTRHEWAPPKPNDGNEEWDSRTRAGRAKRRSAAFDPSSPLNSKLRSNNPKGRGATTPATAASGGGGAGQGATTAARDEIAAIAPNSTKRSASPFSGDRRKSKDEVSSTDESTSNPNQQTLVNPVTGLQVEITNNNRPVIAPCPVSPVLLECSEANCNKKFKNSHGLRYHQSRVHGAEFIDEDSRQSDDTVTSDSRKSPQTVMEESEQNGVHMTNGSENGSAPAEQQESTNANGPVQNGKEGAESTKIGATDQVCDNENSSDGKGESNVNGISSNGMVNNSHSYVPNNGLSVKKDLFDMPDGCPGGPNGIKSEFPNSINAFSRDATRSPAYSDISDDSASFSNSEFIDKFLKSTDCKNPQDNALPISTNLTNPYTTAQQPHQGFNISTPTPFSTAAPQTLFDTNQIQTNNSQPPALSAPPLITPGGNMPATTSSTFINPYNLLNSNYSFNDKPPTIEDRKTGENANTNSLFPSKKDDNASHHNKLGNVSEETQGSVMGDTKQPSIASNSDLSTNGKEAFLPNNNMPIVNNLHQGSPPDKKNIKMEPLPMATEQAQKQFNAERNHNSQIPSGPNPGERTTPKDDKKNRPPSQQPASNQKPPHTPSPRPPSNPANAQQQPPSPFNNDPYKNLNHSPWNIKDEKNVKIKQEPQLPAQQQQPMARPPGPPQYLPQNQYMPTNYNFPAYSQYQSFQSPYYPRFPLSPEQGKNSIGPPPPPFSQNPSAFNPGMGNYTPQTTLAGFPAGGQPGNPGAPGMPGGINNGSQPGQRVIDPSRGMGGPTGPITPGRPPQTHFHTHHHTHVGLGYPMYGGSYENPMVSTQQGAATAMLSPYSPRPTK